MKAPETIPFMMFDKYCMSGDAKMEYAYRNDCGDETQSLINNNFTKEVFFPMSNSFNLDTYIII